MNPAAGDSTGRAGVDGHAAPPCSPIQTTRRCWNSPGRYSRCSDLKLVGISFCVALVLAGALHVLTWLLISWTPRI